MVDAVTMDSVISVSPSNPSLKLLPVSEVGPSWLVVDFLLMDEFIDSTVESRITVLSVSASVPAGTIDSTVRVFPIRPPLFLFDVSVGLEFIVTVLF